MKSERESKRLLTIAETASALSIGRSSVYELLRRGEIPSVKLGRARRVPAAALDEFVAKRLREQAADADIEGNPTVPPASM